MTQLVSVQEIITGNIIVNSIGYVGSQGNVGIISNEYAKITQVVSTDQSFSNLSPISSNVISTGGFIKILGEKFEPNLKLYFSNSFINYSEIIPSDITSTEIRANIPATSVSVYNLLLINPNGYTLNKLGAFTSINGEELGNVTFPNGDFTDVVVTIITPEIIEITGWIFYLKQTKMAGADTIANWPTPVDPTLPSFKSPGDNVSALGMPFQFNYQFTSSILPPGYSAPQQAVRIYTPSNTINKPYGILRGPYMVSKNSVFIKSGDIVKFWYKGEGGQDAFDIFGYLLNVNTGATITLVNRSGINDTGVTPWTEESLVITAQQTGTYKFVFINGCWDFTGGQVTGSSMYVTGVRVVIS